MRTLPARMTEVGRIRIGDQVETRGGKRAPNKLLHYRLTSGSKIALDQVAAIYGGEVRPWEDAPTAGQWEIYTTSNVLQVVLPPGDTLSLCYERWAGGICVARCDGQAIIFSPDDRDIGKPCPCTGKGEEDCKLTARLSVVLPDIPGLGLWRLETHGYYASTELQGMVTLLRSAAQGRPLTCMLRLEERSVRRFGTAREDGRREAQTRRFAVPVLTPLQSYHQIAAGPEIAPPLQLEAANPHAEALQALRDFFRQIAPALRETVSQVVFGCPLRQITSLGATEIAHGARLLEAYGHTVAWGAASAPAVWAEILRANAARATEELFGDDAVSQMAPAPATPEEESEAAQGEGF